METTSLGKLVRDGVPDAECPSALVLPALCPARISVSSSLLAATMNQKSSLREVPQFVSGVLTGNTDWMTITPPAAGTRGFARQSTTNGIVGCVMLTDEEPDGGM